MYKNGKWPGPCALLIVAMSLGGCGSLLQGKQYVFPQAGEPAATVRMAADSRSALHAMTFNEKGCYAGYTPLGGHDGYIDSPVAVGKPLVLTYWNQVGGRQCQVPFSFTPQAGATYLLKSGFWGETRPGLLPMLTHDQYYCGVTMVKKIGAQESVEPIQPLQINTGFACLRFVPK